MASGSNPGDGMAICPCTMGTLGAIAAGIADNLIERAADVMLKERRPLVLVPRETPLSAIHLENMLKLARAGAILLPPCPGFYTHPQSVSDLVDFVVARVLDHLQVPHALSETYAPLARLLALIAARIGARNFPADVRYDDASWVGHRLAELLPLPLPLKQSMLEVNDANLRLAALKQYSEREGLLQAV
jgi:hypothetical protein